MTQEEVELSRVLNRVDNANRRVIDLTRRLADLVAEQRSLGRQIAALRESAAPERTIAES